MRGIKPNFANSAAICPPEMRVASLRGGRGGRAFAGWFSIMFMEKSAGHEAQFDSDAAFVKAHTRRARKARFSEASREESSRLQRRFVSPLSRKKEQSNALAQVFQRKG